MTFDPLATPTRDPFSPSDAPYGEADAPSMDDTTTEPEAPQEAPEPPQGEAEAAAPVKRQKINATFARQLNDRTRVMQERNASFRKLLASVGVTDATQTVSGVRGKYVESLELLDQLDDLTGSLRAITEDVHQTFENL